MRKIPFAGIEFTSQRVRGLRGTSELPGRPSKGILFMVYYVAPGNVFHVLEPPYIIYRNPTCKELSNNIAAREHPRAGSKQMATYQAVAQTQSSWSSSCERTSPRCGRKQMATYQAVVAQTQSSCLIAARERPRAGSKQMATYQAVVAQT